jgi:hypothetical protein
VISYIILSNILDIFSEPAYFGFLEFTYSDNANTHVNNTEENDRLSSVSHFDLCASFAKPQIKVLPSFFGERVLVQTNEKHIQPVSHRS